MSKTQIGRLWNSFWQRVSITPLFIIIGLIASVITIVEVPGLKSIAVSVIQALPFAFNWIWAKVLSANTPLWLCIVIVSIATVLSRISPPKRKAKETVEDWTARILAQVPDYFKYKKDKVDDLTFGWEYHQGERGMPPTIMNLHALCPDCDEPLLAEDFQTPSSFAVAKRMFCAVCNKRFPYFDENRDSGRIGTIIRHRIRTEEYKKQLDKPI